MLSLTRRLAEKIAARLEAFAVGVAKPSRCPRCAAEGRMCWDGFRGRCASFQVGELTVYVPRFRLRRVACGICKVSSTLYPPSILPRRRYQLCVIEHAICGLLGEPASTEQSVASNHDCARRTIGRWLRWLAEIDAGALMRRLLAATGEPVLASVAWAHRRIESARPAARRWLLSSCAAALSGLEALASATGRSPAQIVPELAR
jgi:hypothetical protein